MAASALLLISHPKFDLWLFAWFGFIPLILSIRGKGLVKSFLLSVLCGTLFWSGLVYWLMNVPKYTLLHYLILMPYLGLFFGLFGLIFSLIEKRQGTAAALLGAPFIWVSLEFLRTHFFWLALPWGMLAHSQYLNSTIIQIAAITGAYGVSFLVMAVNAALAFLVFLFFSKDRPGTRGPAFSRSIDVAGLVLVLLTTGFLAASLIYGRSIISRPFDAEKIRISVIQGNISQDKKWNKGFADEIMKIYRVLTLEAARGNTHLIAWPETATPAAINTSPRVHRQVKRIVKAARVPLLIGSAERRKYDLEAQKEFDYTNAAYLLSLEANSVKNQRYDKIHLLPFGEYLPAAGSIPWRHIGVVPVSGYRPGTEFTVFSLGDYRLSSPICWENIFPYITRNFVKNGAQFVINITNAAYFGRTAAPYQVLSMNVFRAIENRRYIARAANIGISCIIDPYGRVVDRVKDDNGEDIFVRGYLTGEIVPLDVLTFYTKYGDVFAWLCVAISVVFLLVALVKRTHEN